jgi:hypothetical protein
MPRIWLAVCWLETYHRIFGWDKLVWIVGVSEGCREIFTKILINKMTSNNAHPSTKALHADDVLNLVTDVE